MITPFGLRHIGLVRALQDASVILDPQSALLEEPSLPLRVALRGYFLKSSGAFTYVLHAADPGAALSGFIQTQVRKPGQAWKIACMAPALDSSADAATVWYRLLLHVCIAAGELRVQRLLACLPQDSPAEEVFRQASFAVYGHELLFGHRRDENTARGELSARVRPAQPEDHWQVLRLYHRVTPRLVAQAETMNGGGADTLPLAVPGLDSQQGYVLPAPSGEMQGYLHIATGPRGSWLRLWVQPCLTKAGAAYGPDERDGAAELLDHALAVLSTGTQPSGRATLDRTAPGNHASSTSLPIYCPVREYEGGMQALLAERGFAPVSACSLLVKHTTVQVRESQRKRVPALEKRAEIVSGVSHSESGMAGKG